MDDRVELFGQFAIDRGDSTFEGACHILVEGDGAGERLLDQVLHQVLRLIGRGLLGGSDNLIEEGCSFSRRCCAGLCSGLCA